MNTTDKKWIDALENIRMIVALPAYSGEQKDLALALRTSFEEHGIEWRLPLSEQSVCEYSHERQKR